MPTALDDFTGNWSLDSPCRHATVVVPSDSVNLNTVSVIYVGVTGNLAVVTAGGETVTFVGVQAGTILPVWVSRVNSTNTTATSMIALSNRAAP